MYKITKLTDEHQEVVGYNAYYNTHCLRNNVPSYEIALSIVTEHCKRSNQVLQESTASLFEISGDKLKAVG